jgi:hypothetical protein
MHPRTLITGLLALLCAPSFAQQAFSPKLCQFFADHPAAYRAVSNALLEAQSARTVHLYYFYASERYHLSTKHHYLEDGSIAGIFVRENQPPCDECIDILFEALNMKGEKHFRELWGRARAGTISRQNFVREMQRNEFQAVVATKRLISGFNLSKEEAAESWNYKAFTQTPTQFEQFVAYSHNLSEGQSQKDYEQDYDSLRGTRTGDPAAPNPQGGANGRQPFSSETNEASRAAASRRSP